jgi:hypothetical protein
MFGAYRNIDIQATLHSACEFACGWHASLRLVLAHRCFAHLRSHLSFRNVVSLGFGAAGHQRVTA